MCRYAARPMEALWLWRVWLPDHWRLAILRVAPASDLAPGGAGQGCDRGPDPTRVALSQWVSKPQCEGLGISSPHMTLRMGILYLDMPMSCRDLAHHSILCLPLSLSLPSFPNEPISCLSLCLPGEPHLRQGPRAKTQEAPKQSSGLSGLLKIRLEDRDWS